jgi:hypothetical protein
LRARNSPLLNRKEIIMSLIYMTNTTPSTVLAGGTLPINVTRRTGCSIQNGDNSVILRKPSYYKVNATITFTATTADDVTIELRKNNILVPGITATTTVGTANTEVHTLSLTGIIRVLCYEGDAILTLVNNSETNITITNVALSIID